MLNHVMPPHSPVTGRRYDIMIYDVQNKQKIIMFAIITFRYFLISMRFAIIKNDETVVKKEFHHLKFTNF